MGEWVGRWLEAQQTMEAWRGWGSETGARWYAGRRAEREEELLE